jgi:hypothetical protein
MCTANGCLFFIAPSCRITVILFITCSAELIRIVRQTNLPILKYPDHAMWDWWAKRSCLTSPKLPVATGKNGSR